MHRHRSSIPNELKSGFYISGDGPDASFPTRAEALAAAKVRVATSYAESLQVIEVVVVATIKRTVSAEVTLQ